MVIISMGAISLGRVEVSSLKIVIKLYWTSISSFTVKENHICPLVSEMLFNYLAKKSFGRGKF